MGTERQRESSRVLNAELGVSGRVRSRRLAKSKGWDRDGLRRRSCFKTPWVAVGRDLRLDSSVDSAPVR
jgi:hypothetical protein